MGELIKKSVKKLPEKQAKRKDAVSKIQKMVRQAQKQRITVSLIMCVVFAASGSFLIKTGMNVGADALADSYSDAYASERDAAYTYLYQSARDRAEEAYHVTNTAVITIGSFEESEKLEVLTANHVEFVTEDRDSNSGNVTAWLEVTGEGTFVVDLKAAEFIVDNAHHHVLVRIPYPELTNVTITDTTKRWFRNDWTNGSYSEGVDLALKQRNEASLQIQKALMSNQYIYENAQKVATSMLVNLVKNFNPDIPNLSVEVEFMD